MEKPRKDAGIDVRCTWSYRVSRLLFLQKQPDLKQMVDVATDDVVKAARAVDDLERPVQETITDRMVAQDDLNDTARLVDRQLKARSPRAEHEQPFTDTFPDGLVQCTEADVEDVGYQFGLLLDRMQRFLDAADPTRVALEPVLVAQIDTWKAAAAAVAPARTKQDAARRAYDLSITAWDTAVDDAYGTLVSRIGKPAAEKCFRKARARAKPAAKAAAKPPAAPAATPAATPVAKPATPAVKPAATPAPSSSSSK